MFIDIDKEVFKKEINPLELFPFKKRGHYNVEGYQKIGKAIFDLTKESKLNHCLKNITYFL